MKWSIKMEDLLLKVNDNYYPLPDNLYREFQFIEDFKENGIPEFTKENYETLLWTFDFIYSGINFHLYYKIQQMESMNLSEEEKEKYMPKALAKYFLDIAHEYEELKEKLKNWEKEQRVIN